MIVQLMVYTTVISLILGLAAMALERAFALARWPRRWLWMATMVLSLGGSAILSQVTHDLPPGGHGAATAGVLIQAQGMSPPPSVASPQRSRPIALVATGPVFDGFARRLWLATSILLIGFYLIGALRLLSAARQWPRQTLGRYNVRVSPNVGPAVFGVIRPAIVVPQWLLEQPMARREAALRHEDQHIVARDPALLLAALLLLALTAWNLPLWWQLRRLRLAIEVDCDSRVLRTGMERRHYLDTLLCINQYAGRMPVGTVAIVGHASQLEQRVRDMTARRPRHFRLWMAGWALVALPLLVVAAELAPPAPTAAHAHLGIGLADLDVNGAATSIAQSAHRGALVTYVRSGDVADRAGLKRGDVVMKFASTTIVGANTLVAAVAHTPPDARVHMIVRRGNSELNLLADFSIGLPPEAPSGSKSLDASDWDALRDASTSISRPQLRDELVRMARLDQMQKLPAAMKSRPAENTVIIAHGPRPDPAQLAANVQRLKEIIARYGWPTVSMVGVRGADAAAAIAFGAHDDPAFQARALALMEPLVPRDEVPTMYFAALYDTVHTPQRFGSSIECVNGVMTPTKPIEDPEHLEQRRSALGLLKVPKFCTFLPDPTPIPQ